MGKFIWHCRAGAYWKINFYQTIYGLARTAEYDRCKQSGEDER